MKIEQTPGYTKSVCCASCGEVRTVRKDSNPKYCISCAGRIRGEKGLATIRAKAKKSPCKNCGTETPARLNYSYCSVRCRKEAKRIERVCKCCGVTFKVLKSSVCGNTNATGNFCSRPCYEKWLCQTERVSGRGSQWKKKRSGVISASPFCAMCGTKENLQVHHIVPFRLTQDNSADNLIPLCVKHHKVVETVTHDIEAAGVDTPTMKVGMGTMIREHQDRWRLYHSRISA